MKVTMKYTTFFVSSNGQPPNGHETHSTLSAALTAWAANIGYLKTRSGGDSTLHAWEDPGFDSEYAEPIGSIYWIETSQGGFVTAAGKAASVSGESWYAEVSSLARYLAANGATLTAEVLVNHMSE